jgi:Helix-turn-helix domain
MDAASERKGSIPMSRTVVAVLTTIPRRELYPLAEAITLLGLSHAQVYLHIQRGELVARKIGTRTMIAASAIEVFIDKLPEAS